MDFKKIGSSFKKLQPSNHKKLNVCLFLPLSFVLSELCFKFFVLESFGAIGYTVAAAMATGMVFSLVLVLFKNIPSYIITLLVSIVSWLIFCTQTVYKSIFDVVLTLGSALSGAKGVAAEGIFLLEGFKGALYNLHFIIAFFIPVFVLILFRKRWFDFGEVSVSYKKITAVATAVLLILSVGINALSGVAESGRQDDTSAFAQYFCSEYKTEKSVKLFGVLTVFRLDIQHLLFGGIYKSSTNGHKKEVDLTVETEKEPENKIDTSPNIMNIDFDSLIKSASSDKLREMHEYFKSVTPTKKNKYTGLFKGCNLIYITAEGFSTFAVNKDLTPTLYRLSHEGIVCENFYNPVWGVSTSDGEYVNCLGLIPKSGVWSMMRSGSMYVPFALGNQFRKLKSQGYGETFAYHNNTYNYYDRDISHPNLGYTYKALGNGLDVKRTWPESDLEMFQKSMPDYVNQDKFSVYYMTVSGHLEYSFSGNNMSSKNKEVVKNLKISDQAKAYIACQIELDKALEYALKELEKAGKLENTVIVMGADHYPYGLEKSTIDELAGHKVDRTFELYKSTLVMWKHGMEPITVTEPVSSMDILPTVSNLFSLEYDSRLLAGRDIFGGTTPLVIFNDQSFMTDKCTYDASSGKIGYLTKPVDDEYIKNIKNVVSNRFKYCEMILDNRYYNTVFGVN